MPPSKQTVEFDRLLQSRQAPPEKAESAFDQQLFFQETQERADLEDLQTWEDEGGASTHAGNDKGLLPLHRSLSHSTKEAEALT